MSEISCGAFTVSPGEPRSMRYVFEPLEFQLYHISFIRVPMRLRCLVYVVGWFSVLVGWSSASGLGRFDMKVLEQRYQNIELGSARFILESARCNIKVGGGDIKVGRRVIFWHG